MKNKISFNEKLAFAVGDGGCNFVWTTIGSFLTLYYTDSVGISAAVIGTIMLLSRIVDGFSDLGMGVIIDRTHTRWGKARPWILWSAIPMGVGLILLFSVPGSFSSGAKIAYAAISYTIVAAVIYTACNLGYNTLLSLEAPDPKDRVTMSSIRFFCTMGVVLIINYNTMKLVHKFGWTGMATIFGLIAVILLLITFFFTKERNFVEVKEEQNDKDKEKVSIAHSFKILFMNKYFVLISLIFVINYTALGINNGIRIYFARDVLGNVALMGTLTLCFILPKMIGNLIYPQISKLLGKWKSLVIGYILEMLGVVIMLVMPASLPGTITGLVLLGIGGIPHTAGLFAMVVDVIDYGEWKTGERIDALTYSATSFGMKVGAGLGAAIVGWGLAWGNYNGTLKAQAVETVNAIKLVFTAVPLALFAIGLVILLFANIDKIYPQISRDLAERRSNK
ncbi:MFS transporter [Clostridium oryzae]|uniref:Inner membrane symporter YicJ n=1 Tax=Clostridium oryzae TaxID=1450648 RepID=A0A1V4IYK2_9CLOT|nr:glycoside-pentoside-hexuronide (GPH):cation symporter [Clostridium oryzae]OPJ65148.1 inner membrane symporter YicJ [Clostridium oryzae]